VGLGDILKEFEERGYSVREKAHITGVSGLSHRFSYIIVSDGQLEKRVAVNVYDAFTVQALLDVIAKYLDTGIHQIVVYDWADPWAEDVFTGEGPIVAVRPNKVGEAVEKMLGQNSFSGQEAQG